MGSCGCVYTGVLCSLIGISTVVAAGGPGGGPQGVVGEDVVLPDIGNGLTRNGTVGGITAYSADAVICNIGDEWAENIPNNNRHPLISQNLYRIKDGRFEQVGMSWLYHMWCAADFFSCGDGGGTPNGSCTYMAISVANVQSAGLTGGQTDLGPRSEVDASSGFYPYPYEIGWNQSGDAVYKRLQVHNTDLADSDGTEGSGSWYLYEHHILAPGEITNATGTHHNNASWRRVVRGPLVEGGYELSFAGEASAQQSAIEAWPQFVPAAEVIEVLVPEAAGPQGRLLVGFLATDLGDGFWAYDYAVSNYNSHRGVGSFSLDMPDDVGLDQIEFHDVEYHSGEPFDGTDWEGLAAAGAVTWATVPFEVEENANAIRWGTAYSFRVVATGPPHVSTAHLGLFRPGPGSDSLAIPVLGPGSDCNGNNVADSIDIGTGGLSDIDANGVPDACQPLVAAVDAVGSRLLRVSLGGVGEDTFAIRVVGDQEDSVVSCVDVFVQADGTLGSEAVIQALAGWGDEVLIQGESIIPSGGYTISFDELFDPQAVATGIWCDADGNRVANFGDILLSVFGFQGNFVVPLEVLDVDPCEPNGIINYGDILVSVLAFQGLGYQETSCPLPCG